MSESRIPIRTLLFVSLALNLLVIGAVVGAKVAGVRLERGGQGAVAERLPGPRAFMAALPPQTREKIRADFVAGMAQTRQLRVMARQAHVDAFESARTEPYDIARVQSAFSRMRVADAAVAASFQDQIATSFAELTPPERREALEALRNAQPARGGGPFRQRPLREDRAPNRERQP